MLARNSNEHHRDSNATVPIAHPTRRVTYVSLTGKPGYRQNPSAATYKSLPKDFVYTQRFGGLSGRVDLPDELLLGRNRFGSQKHAHPLAFQLGFGFNFTVVLQAF